MSVSLIDWLNSEKEVVDEINNITKEVSHLQDNINALMIRKRNASDRLDEIRYNIANYIKTNVKTNVK